MDYYVKGVAGLAADVTTREPGRATPVRSPRPGGAAGRS